MHGRCITRDLKWGTKVPEEGYDRKVFYVWFDAPIGYISITANYLGAENDDWKKWWQNPENVELYQFMGKDNTTFHTVIFPATMIGSNQGWTLLKTVSTTEYLQYESGKFSKSRNVGVFGDNAMDTGIPVEVWRYYLLVNRPESQDTIFNWDDFVSKNNNELLKNLGNFTNRCLAFVMKSFKGVVPKYEGELHTDDKAFLDEIYKIFSEYLVHLEEIKIKEALRTAMSFSTACNVFQQAQAPWDV